MTLFTKIIRKKRLSLILPELGKGWKILDIGCGDGWLVKELKERGFDCIGIDILFTNQDISANEFKDNQFDCSLLIEVIEHLPPSHIPEIGKIKSKKIVVSTINPHFNNIDEVGIKLKLYGSKYTVYIKCYYLEDIPFCYFKLKISRRYFFVDQFGIYERIKK